MDNFSPFVIAVYGASAVVLVGYLGYLFARLRAEARAAGEFEE